MRARGGIVADPVERINPMQDATSGIIRGGGSAGPARRRSTMGRRPMGRGSRRVAPCVGATPRGPGATPREPGLLPDDGPEEAHHDEEPDEQGDQAEPA